jgi:magnesium-transporting ATPase (P-type)
VGDVILIKNDDEVPADVAVLACGGIQVSERDVLYVRRQ